MKSCEKPCFPCSLPVKGICCFQTHQIWSVHWKQPERKAKEQIGWWSFRSTRGLWILNHPWICNAKTSKYRFASIPHTGCLTARDTNPAHGRKNESTAASQLRSPAWTLKQVRTCWVNGRTTFKQQLHSWHLFYSETTWHLINDALGYDSIIDDLWWQCCCFVVMSDKRGSCTCTVDHLPSRTWFLDLSLSWNNISVNQSDWRMLECLHIRESSDEAFDG